MKYIKKYKIFESRSTSLYDRYGEELINLVDDDIEFIKDKLLELSDLGYYTLVSYTPLTHAKVSKYPQFFFDIKARKDRHPFYGYLNGDRELVDGVLCEIFSYLSENGYKSIQGMIERDPKDYKFINNPTCYQFVFEKR